MTIPNYAYIYEENAAKSLNQLKRKKQYLEKRLNEIDHSDANFSKETMYQVTLDIVNELIEKKSSK